MTRQIATKGTPAWYAQVRKAGRPTLLLLGMVAAALVYVTFAILFHSMKSHHEAMLLQEAEQKVAEKQQEKTRLEGKIALLKSPQGAVEESRRKGMVKEGEHAVTFQFIPPSPGALEPSAAIPTATTLSGYPLWPVIVLLALSFLVGSGWLIRLRRLAQLRRPAATLTPRSELQRRARARKPHRT